MRAEAEACPLDRAQYYGARQQPNASAVTHMDEPPDVPISATSDRTPSSDAVRSRRVGRTLIGVAIGILFLILFGGVATVWILMHPAPTPTIVASFRADYQEGGPGPGWRYLWNATDEIGKTNGYRDLVWNGSKYGF